MWFRSTPARRRRMKRILRWLAGVFGILAASVAGLLPWAGRLRVEKLGAGGQDSSGGQTGEATLYGADHSDVTDDEGRSQGGSGETDDRQ